MQETLEAPSSAAELYLYRGDEVVAARPVFTGDVFWRRDDLVGDVAGHLPSGIQVLQHPCALRSNGVDLMPRLLTAEVVQAPAPAREHWDGHFKVMHLPHLTIRPAGLQHATTKFVQLSVIAPEELTTYYERIACLSEIGVNLLLQRWVHHNSRVVVPTYKYAEQTAGPAAEAELAEEWVTERMLTGSTQSDAEKECHDFLRQTPPGTGLNRQEALRDPQRRAEVRRAARAALRSTPRQ